MLFQVQTEAPNIQPETVFTIGNFMVTNAMLLGTVITILALIVCLYITKTHKLKPTKLQTAVELMVESFINLIAQIAGSKSLAQKLLPLIGALFLFIGISNIITLVPGISALTYNSIPLFRTPTNDFNTTFSIALAMVILAQFMSIKEFGFFGHVGKYIKWKGIIQGFKKGIMEGFIAIIDFFIGLLDIVSEIAKVISLSLRLFGNMFAGEMLASVLLGTFAFLLPAPWVGMNLLVGLLQA
ncbi:MAG: hypothetical protein COU30_03440, partial [Candidatus Magasanikbacteria bacterium CG10_big_fil_rev_8_21_14_0_10_38_6]